MAVITKITPFPGTTNFKLTNRSTSPASARLSPNTGLSAEGRTDRTTGTSHHLRTLEEIEPPW